MQSSPRTPTRPRKSSNTSINLSFTSPSRQSNGYHSKPGSTCRRSSQYSIPSPVTPRPLSSYERSEYGFPNGSSNNVQPESSNGLGNLADELAEAFDEDEEVGARGELPEVQYDSGRVEHGDSMQEIFTPTSSLPYPSRERSLSPPKRPTRSRNHRRQNSQYDGSDYGDDSDLQGVDGISPTLDSRMAAIEHLARRGTEANGSELDGVAKRVVGYLKDLGSQSDIENGTSRLITTYIALTSHLSNQTRTISTLAYPLMSPLSAPPNPEDIEELLPLLETLMNDLPTPTSQPLTCLHSLHASTAELTSILTHLSDTLHMTRQTTSLASRRLRSATEMVLEMRREAEAREEAVRWAEKGNWEQRLAGRECARVCGDVIEGFEEVCNSWRARLLGVLEVGAA